MQQLEHCPTHFRCARDSIRIERRQNETDPSKEQTILWDDGRVIGEIGTRREKLSMSKTIMKLVQTNTYVEDPTTKDTLQLQPKVSSSMKIMSMSSECLKTTEQHSPSPEDGENIRPTKSHPAAEQPAGSTPMSSDLMQAEFEPEENEEDEEVVDDYFTGDVQCAWCDDGGQLLMCDGPCMRGFHIDASCNVLDIQEDLKTAIVNSKHPFECPNCWAKIHQCFKCNREFKLDMNSEKPLITKCDVADCGRFYCQKCQKEITKKCELRLGIKNRTTMGFICPLHFCRDCGSKEDHPRDILFPCRRCPTALHERCMSRKVRDDPTRVWRALFNEDGTLNPCSQVSSNFFYCGKHQTQNMMQGPRHEVPLFSQSLWKKWRTAYALKFRSLNSSITYLPIKTQKTLPANLGAKLEDFAVASRVFGKQNGAAQLHESQFLMNEKNKKRRKQTIPCSEEERSLMIDAMIERGSNEVEKHREQMREMIEDAMKEISIDNVEKDLANTYPYCTVNAIKLTEERLEYFIRSLELANYEPPLIKERIPESMMRHMKKALKGLRVSCSPFLFPKYTSFGRHFTKTPILEHVANHLIAYLKPNDMVVDFSCGSNEFLGIISDFCRQNNLQVRVRGYDLFTPLRMDGFVKKSWKDVRCSELDDGDQLIIGLNPPFGVNAYLANEFVIHAATMKPKLMLLICPPHTTIPRNYTLIHEDNEICANKAFYIPGLRADQGNDVTPPFRVLKRSS